MMENKCKRFLSLLLAFVMVLGMFPAGHVHAADGVDGTTINMNVDDKHEITVPIYDAQVTISQEGVITAETESVPTNTRYTVATTATRPDAEGNLPEGKYVILNRRMGTALESNPNGNKLWMAAYPSTAEVWTVKAVADGYTVTASNGKYLTIGDGTAGTTDAPTTLTFAWNNGGNKDSNYADAWSLCVKNVDEHLCQFGSGTAKVAAGYEQEDDQGAQWDLYAVTPAQEYTWKLADETVTAIEPGSYYIFEAPGATSRNASLVSAQWSDTNAGGGGTSMGLRMENTKGNFNEKNVWKITASTTEGKYNVQDLCGWNMFIASGKAMVTPQSHPATVAQGVANAETWQITNDDSVYLHWWGIWNGTPSYTQIAGWSSKDGENSQWNIYKVNPTPVGSTTVTITAVQPGTTTLTIGDVTYTITVNEVHVHKFVGEVTKKPTCKEKGVETFTCECGEDTYTEDINIDPTNHVNKVDVPGTPATLTAPGVAASVYCNDCETTVSGGDPIPQLTVKNAQPMMDSWNSGIVSLDDCLYTLSGTEGAYSLDHGGNYYVRPGANSTTGRPQQNEPFAGLTLQIVDGKLRISAGSNHLHVHLAGTAHNESGTHPWWDKCSGYHADAGNGSHDFYLLKANANSTFAGVPGYEVVTSLENAVGGSYLIAFTNKTGEWFVMYPSTETVSLAKVVTDAVTHTHNYTVETVTKDPTCAETGLKDLKCSCGHFHAEHKNVEIPATGEHTWETEGEVTTDPTCTTEGVKTFKCTVEGCEETKTETIPALGHCWDRENAGYCVTEYTCCKCWKATNPNFIKKIYFDNTKTQWKTVVAFFSVTNVGGWARSLGEENGIYTFLVHKDAETVEFKNGSSGAETITTRGFAVEEGKTYSVELVEVYFQENNAWNEIHVECYDTDGDKLATSVSKTPVDGKHVLYVDKNTDDIIAYFHHEDGSLGYEIFEDVEAGKTYFYPECTHSYDNACDADCNVCGATRDVAHTPAADDGDCTTAIACSVCGQEATAAKSHAWAESGTYTEPTFEADGFTTYNCTNSGCTKTNVVTHEGTMKVAVAEANGVKYATLAEAIAVGGEVTLLANVELTERLDVDKLVTLELNDHTISGDFVDAFGMIYVKKGAELNLEGDGSIIAEKTHAIGNYGDVSVEGGNIVTNADETYAGLYNFYYQADYYGSAEISGGSVDSVFNCGYLVVDGGKVTYLDNSGCLDVSGGEINEIYAQDGSDAPGVDGAGTITIADPANITVPEGFKLVNIGEDTYQVVAKTYVAELNGTKYETLAVALSDAVSGDTVLLLADCAFEGTVPVGATLDLNGHNLFLSSDPLTGRISLNGGAIVFANESGNTELIGPNSDGIKTTDGILIISDTDTIFIDGNFIVVRLDFMLTVAGTARVVVESSEIDEFNVSLDSTEASIVGPDGLNITTTLEGYKVVYENGTYTLVEKTVAEFNGTEYETLAAALNAAKSGGTVKLLADCEIENDIPDGAVLDLNGHKLYVTASLTGCISINSGAIVEKVGEYETEVFGPTSPIAQTTNGVLLLTGGGITMIAGTFNLVLSVGKVTVAGTAKLVVERSNTTNISLDSTTASIEGPEDLNVTTTLEGYEVVYANGTHTLAEKAPVVNYVAKIGEQGYATLAAAISAANAGDTITFLADITEDVTISKSVTIDGADKTFTGQMKLTNKANVTIKNVNFDGNGYNGYAIETRGAYYVTIDGCTAKNYYGFVQLASATDLTTVKNVTVSGMNYGVKIDYSNAVILENVDITASVAAVLNSNYGAKPITIKNSALNILGTWTRNNTIKTTYTFEGANSIDEFITDAAIDNFKLAAGATLTAPQDITVTTDVENHEVVYENGTYKLAEKKAAVAMIGEQGYASLTAAITAAKTGDTITFVADITENVTINKSVTIDGAGKTYTGTMNGNKGLTITIENVNFVNGGFDKPNAQKSTTGNYTIKNCTFVDDGNFGYAVRIYGANKLVVENCTVSGYKWSFLYVVKGTNTVSVKNVTVENCPNYAVYFASGVNNATFENLTVKNSNRGFVINNSANRSFTIKDCKMENVGTAIDYTGGTKAITCTAQGNNDFGTAVLSEYAKVVLTENATLTAPEGLNVTTNAGDGYKVIYEEGVYKVVYAPAAMIGTKGYATLGEAFADAQDGDTIVVMKNIDLAKETPILLDGSYNTYFKVEGKNVTIDMNGMTISGEYADTSNMLVGVFSTDNGGHLTVTGNGTVNVTATAKVYSLFANYEGGCSITIEDGSYTLDVAHDSLLYSGCNTAENEGITVNGGTFILGNVGEGTNGKPWIINCLGGNDNATVVNGGTFNSDISHQFWANEVSIPENLALKNNGDGTWTFVEAVACAEEKATSTGATVRKVGYATLQEAIDAVANGKTVTLLKDIELGADDVKAIPGNLTAMINVAGKSLTLDMNGKTITAAYDASELLYTVIYVGDGASLTVKGEGKIDLITGDTKAGKYDCVAYMFLKSGDTGALNIENGTFTANKVEDSMVYTNGDKVVNIKGGNWTLGNVGTKTNGAPWIFNTKGQNERTILVSGGTYNFNVAKQYYACEASIVDANGNLSYVVDNKDGTWTVTGQTAEVGIVTPTWRTNYLLGYATFKDAVASIAKGAAETTIVLQKDITVKGQFIGHSYAQKVVIDLNGYTMSSTDKTLTVYRAGTEVTVKNGTVYGNTTGGTIQTTYGGKLTLGENVTIKSGGSATALKVDANATLIVDQDTTYVLGGKNDLVVADGATVQISAGYFKKPVQQAWCAEGYVPTDKLENGYYSVMKDPSIGMEAKIGDTYYESLQAAIEAAQTGDVIVVVNDITVDTTAAVMNSGEYAAIYNVAEKAITIDLNGKKIEVTANAADLESYKSGILLGVFCVDTNGSLTLTGNGTVTANAVDASLTSDDSHLYSLMVAYGAGSKLTVENGTTMPTPSTPLWSTPSTMRSSPSTAAPTPWATWVPTPTAPPGCSTPRARTSATSWSTAVPSLLTSSISTIPLRFRWSRSWL